MTNREIMRAILAGERLDFTPQWLMGFANMPLVEQVIPTDLHYDGFYLYPRQDLHEVMANGKRCWPHILMDSAGILDSIDKKSFDSFLQLSRESRSRKGQ